MIYQTVFNFTKIGHLKTHTNSVHEGNRFNYDICRSIFAAKGNLKKHTESVHGGKRFNCDISPSSVTLTLFYMGGSKQSPWLIIVHLSSEDVLNWLIFHDFVPFNIWKVLGRPFLGLLFENFKNFYIEDIFHTKSKGGDPSIRVKMHLFLGPF